MYEKYEKKEFPEKSMEADAAKIDDQTWKEMEDERVRQTLDTIVHHVQALEDRVAALENVDVKCVCGCCD